MAERTEKATPKRRQEARQRGQVARSVDLNGAVILLAGLAALSAFAPGTFSRLQGAMVEVLALTRHPEVVSSRGLGGLASMLAGQIAMAFLPLGACCLVVALATGVAQVGFRPTLAGLKPDPKRLNPASGLKHLVGPNSLVEAAKSLAKVGVVGAITALAVFPKLQDLAALVGDPPPDLLRQIASMVLAVAWRAAAAYLLIAFVDFGYQKWRFEKGLRMDKQEIKDEAKQQQLPAEVRSHQRRRGMELARARMMGDVPTADVVVTNPTHFSVALRYTSAKPAPVVVAKGQDHLALRIREIAREHDVAIVPDPPLARSLYANVEVGQQIPEELFQAVAQLLAYVYRVAGMRRAAAGARA